MARRIEDWRAVAFWLPVVGVLALSQTALGAESSWSGGTGLLALTSVLLCGPLLLRISLPLLAASLLAVVVPLQMQLGGTLHFGTFVAVLVTAYSLGRHGRGRDVFVGLPLILAGIAVAMREFLAEDAVELVFPAFYTAAAAGAGAVIRRLSTQAADLRHLNRLLARERDVSTQLAIASERMRLARDLHDAVAHSLTVAVVQAQDCEDAIESDPERAREASRRIQEVARAGLEDLRHTVRVLREEADAPGPGAREIPALAEVAAAGLRAEVHLDGEIGLLDEDRSNTLFRITQECLTNVMKHSDSRTARVDLVIDPDAATLTVVDPGPAAAAALPSGGRGLTGMSERLALLGGELEARPEDDGFLVRARLPLAGAR